MLELLLVGGVLFYAWQSGALASVGFPPSQAAAAQNLSGIINQEEMQAYQSSGGQIGGPDETAGIFNGLAATGTGIGKGFSTGGPVGAAVGAAQGLMSVITSIFGGMALRARQATIENQALNFGVQAFDQTLQQVNSAFLSGQISRQEAIALVQQIYSQYWTIMTPKIQPNRNGCASGGSCPGTAIQFESTNGVPAGFCAGTNGAVCCVGCGPIRLGVERTIAAIQSGGVATIPPVGGDHYGLQTRLAYSLQW